MAVCKGKSTRPSCWLEEKAQKDCRRRREPEGLNPTVIDDLLLTPLHQYRCSKLMELANSFEFTWWWAWIYPCMMGYNWMTGSMMAASRPTNQSFAYSIPGRGLCGRPGHGSSPASTCNAPFCVTIGFVHNTFVAQHTSLTSQSGDSPNRLRHNQQLQPSSTRFFFKSTFCIYILSRDLLIAYFYIFGSILPIWAAFSVLDVN